MARTERRPTDRWSLRTVPDHLRASYLAEGWWTDESLGDLVADGLSTQGGVAFDVHSATRPWSGTFAQVDRAAREVAASLRDRGVEPGDVVMFQLPNWMEAGITFWAAAYLGAVVVPVVHFYGPKEIGYILDVTEPAVVVTAADFGGTDLLALHAPLLAGHDDSAPTWLVVGGEGRTDLPTGAAPFDSMLGGEAVDRPAPVDPDAPAIIAFTSGTTSNPKGVIHSHRTIGFETRQLSAMFPEGGPPQITGAPVGHFIGMVNAFLTPLVKERPVNLVDVWDPGEVLRLMKDHRLGMGGGATYFITSLLDHPDFTDEHLPYLPFAGLGGSSVPIAVMERLTGLGIPAFRSYGSTEHPSITGCSLDDPEQKRHETDGPALPAVEIRLAEDGEISSRGPDCCLGYTDPALTAAAFDDEGWYRTGDVGVLDDDGYLSITDRIADVIIRGGENISAVEVEEVMMCLEGVIEVAVVATPDDRLGERAAAVVRMADGAPAPSLEAVREHFGAAGLAKQKWPESIRATDDFPRTPSGKIQKYRLRRQLADEAAGR